MDLFKKEVTKKNKKTNFQDSGQKLNKEILDKHMKEAAKGNNIQKFELKDKQKVLEDIAKNSPILILKVLNSSYNLNKGTHIRLNCFGLDEIENLNRKDGICYFGHVQEDEIDSSIDFSIPIAKTTEKNDNM
jgi:hypothetical protein